MIIFDGIEQTNNNKINIIKFKNEFGGSVSIPLDATTTQLISTYLKLIMTPYKEVERSNDESSSEEDNSLE